MIQQVNVDRKKNNKKDIFFFFFKQKTAYEIYQCDWSSDVCSSDLGIQAPDGTIYICYDYDRTGAREICMTKFTEEDITRSLHDAMPPHFIVNKATGR